MLEKVADTTWPIKNTWWKLDRFKFFLAWVTELFIHIHFLYRMHMFVLDWTFPTDNNGLFMLSRHN